jgi:hypothetical protein
MPVSRRFCITLEDRQYEHLTQLSEFLSVPVAELIRRSIDLVFGLDDQVVQRGAGVWRRVGALIGRRAGVRFTR